MEPILDVKGLVTSFFTESGVVEALDGIDLTVYPKESVGVVGESGCGKTQTAYSILRILAQNGKIMDGEEDFTKVLTLYNSQKVKCVKFVEKKLL